nr:MAG TPA: hypothetical protein [Caudoviricetes sp.]
MCENIYALFYVLSLYLLLWRLNKSKIKKPLSPTS